MRILYVDQTGQLGGGEISLLDVIRNSGHDAEVALFSDGPFRRALEQMHVPVHLFSAGKAGAIRREANLASILSSGPNLMALRRQLAALTPGFDVIYANSQKAFLLSAAARQKGQPLLWHLRDMLTAQHFSPFLRRAAVLTGNFAATAIIVNSQATRDSFLQAGGRPQKTYVVYNGIDPLPFNTVSDLELQQLGQQIGVTGKFTLGVFGRLTPWKGQHIVIDALASLPGVHLLVVGGALFGEDAYSDSLRAQALRLGVDQRVHFLGFRQDIPTLMKLVDVVIHSSIAPEPFGRVIVEAMLAARPVVAARAGGALEIIQQGDTGLLVEPGSVSELAAAVEQLQTDRNLYQRLAAAGFQRATRVFSVDAMMAGIEKVITTALWSADARTTQSSPANALPIPKALVKGK